MPDLFQSHADRLADPARQAYNVTPSDTNVLPLLPKALLIGGAGAITLRAVDAAADVTITVVAGQCLPVRASHIRAAGTTATGIVALS